MAALGVHLLIDSILQSRNFLALRRIFCPEAWCTRFGAITSIIFAFGLAVTVAALVDTSTPEKTSVIRIAVLVGGPLCAVVIWAIATQVYLRSGRAIKIGLIDDVRSVDMEEWQETRETIRQLFDEGVTRERLSLRLIPRSVVATDETLKRFCKRYRFALIVRVAAVKGRTDCEERVLTVVNKDLLDNDWTRATMSHIRAMCQTRGQQRSVSDLANPEARNVHDALIFLAAATLFVRQSLDDAGAILRYLDSKLEGEFAVTQRPRAQIRWLDCQCRMAPSVFDVSEGLPSKDEFDRALASIHDCLRYGDEIPGVYLQVARLEFLNGNLNAAVEYTERAANHSNSGHIATTVALNRGFLALVDARWANCCEHYKRLLARPECDKLNWKDLAAFADLSEEIGYGHAIFARYLYRHLGQLPISDEIKGLAERWLSEDQSRQTLRDLLHGRKRAERDGRKQNNPVQNPNPQRANRRKKRKRRHR